MASVGYFQHLILDVLKSISRAVLSGFDSVKFKQSGNRKFRFSVQTGSGRCAPELPRSTASINCSLIHFTVYLFELFKPWCVCDVKLCNLSLPYLLIIISQNIRYIICTNGWNARKMFYTRYKSRKSMKLNIHVLKQKLPRLSHILKKERETL